MPKKFSVPFTASSHEIDEVAYGILASLLEMHESSLFTPWTCMKICCLLVFYTNRSYYINHVLWKPPKVCFLLWHSNTSFSSLASSLQRKLQWYEILCMSLYFFIPRSFACPCDFLLPDPLHVLVLFYSQILCMSFRFTVIQWYLFFMSRFLSTKTITVILFFISRSSTKKSVI